MINFYIYKEFLCKLKFTNNLPEVNKFIYNYNVKNLLENNTNQNDYIVLEIGENKFKLDNTMFEISSMEDDPRTYRYDRIYSDFDHDEHLDLLKPKFKAKQLEYTKLVTHAYFSRIMFKKYSNYLRF